MFFLAMPTVWRFYTVLSSETISDWTNALNHLCCTSLKCCGSEKKKNAALFFALILRGWKDGHLLIQTGDFELMMKDSLFGKELY